MLKLKDERFSQVERWTLKLENDCPSQKIGATVIRLALKVEDGR